MRLPGIFDSTRHYWTRISGLVYSSERNADIPATDEAYRNWLLAGGVPTSYPTDEDGNESVAELAAVLGHSPYPPTLEEIKAAKLQEVAEAFHLAEQTGYLTSSVGYPINATERANRDIAGLITRMEASGEQEALFCDYNNQMRSVSLDNLKTMQLEIIVYGQRLYAWKWTLRDQINRAATPADVATIAWPTEV